jgi:hypothetical protein
MRSVCRPAITKLEIRAAAVLAANLNLRILTYNLVANAALYLFYQLTPFSEGLQTFNRAVLWKLFLL